MNIYKILLINIYLSTGFCGSSGELKLIFQHFPYVLKSQIKNRNKMNQYFEEPELWYLLYNLIEAAFIFEKKNRKMGDLHPNNCLLNENGQMKIFAICSLPDEVTNYDKIIQSTSVDVYLAPQQIDQLLLEKGIYPNVDPNRAQIYSIGMTMLQAASLTDCYYCYNRGPLNINKKKISEFFKIITLKYSPKFCQYIGNMLQEQPKRRKSGSQIFSELNPYELEILELRPFIFFQNQSRPNVVSNLDLISNNRLPTKKYQNDVANRPVNQLNTTKASPIYNPKAYTIGQNNIINYSYGDGLQSNNQNYLINTGNANIGSPGLLPIKKDYSNHLNNQIDPNTFKIGQNQIINYSYVNSHQNTVKGLSNFPIGNQIK